MAGKPRTRGAAVLTTRQYATAKAEETRERILDAALRLFRDRGFDETTMREIAAEAGVATGAAYYYFSSKEELVMAFYERTAAESREALPARLEKSKDLADRIRGVITMKLDQFADHRRLMVALVRIGIDPVHPLSPFGEQTAPMREESINAFASAIEGARPAVPNDFKEELPRLLWLYQMGVILFWMFDQSPGQRKTKKLLDGTVDLIVRLVGISGLPLMRPIRKRVLDLVKSIEE